MAAMLWALWELRDRLPTLDYEIWFAGLMGEEAGQHGAKAFVEKNLVDFALVGEPTGLAIVHTHKGACWLKLITHGRAVHASTPEAGENAIEKMMDVLLVLRQVIAPRWKTMTDPVLGSPTISIGTIQGGSKTNIVPDRCEVMVDCRTIPAQDREGMVEELASELSSVCPDLEVTWTLSRPLGTDPEHPLIAALEQAGGKRTGAPWFCDAAVFSAAGIPSVAAGPGSIAQAHTRDEWIAIEALYAGVEYFKAFLLQLGS